ncbi:hypothetical protein [Hyphomonas sp.]|uniref:hypothetical protein n=1 Tax=Hyphomonas sp. TaxID=87 RepID=UPI003F6FC834
MAKIDQAQAKVLAEAQIEHIQLFIRSEDPDLSMLRSFVTNWFAYNEGGVFLNRNGRPRWLNKFHPIKHAQLYLGCHFRSVQAARLIGSGGEEGDLVVDHAIPFSHLRKMLDVAPDTRSGIVKCLKENLRLGVITQAENKKLNDRKLRAAMPKGATSVTARYEAAGIKLAK